MPHLFYLLLDLVVVIGLAVLSVAILLRDWRAEANALFAFFAVSVGVWILANFISNDVDLSAQVATAANYFVFLFSYAANLALLRFAIMLSDDRKAWRHFKQWLPLLYGIGLIAATPLVGRGVQLQSDVYAVEFGPAIIPYGICLVGTMIATFVVVGRNMRKTRGVQRDRLKVLFLSLCFALPGTLLAEFILPTTTGWFGFTNIGILPMLILVSGLYYSVIKHKLFDLRFFVVRAAAYGLSVILITIFLLLPAIWVISSVFHVVLAPWKLVVLAIISLILTIAYRYLRRIFDKITTRIFYRHFYNPQDVYDQLGDLLVRTIDLSRLQQGSERIITQALAVRTFAYWLSGDGHKRELTVVERLFKAIQDPIVLILDEVDGHHDDIESMRRLDVAAIVRLRTTHGELGYMALGYKESGANYTQQDRRLLSTIADEIAISMQNALHFEEIQNFNKTLQQQVSDATSKLRKTNSKLKQLDETKDEFITMASHQLRTPLTSVKGYLSMVLEGDAGKLNKQQEQLLTQSFISSQRMVYLIADLLNLSRLNTGKFVIEPIPVDLREVVQGEIDQLRETAKARNLTLVYNRPPDFPLLSLDETKIHQVVMNFIDNAIYYTPSGGVIHIELHDNPTNVEYLVKDNGIGVPKREQPHLFTKFYRAGNARKARPDGTGLGLFMAKKVIAAQDGIIVFDSIEGKGSTFGFRFTKSHHLAASEPETKSPTQTVAKEVKGVH